MKADEPEVIDLFARLNFPTRAAPKCGIPSGVANSDDQKANILASTSKTIPSENKRPGDVVILLIRKLLTTQF
ncbi:hypothetical protein TNCV_3543321 [Trichonephila clavipes]|nr:hypothetical protein TNCV_3543321 [Trichonephila clavipes]